jgi:chromosome segregation ATPase
MEPKMATKKTQEALEASRSDLLEAEAAFQAAKQRSSHILKRRREASERVAAADRELAAAQRAANEASDAHVNGDIDFSGFEAAFAAVEQCRQRLAAAQDLESRFANAADTSHALDELRLARDDARETFGASVCVAEMDIPNLTERMQRAFIAWAWARRIDLMEAGSERGEFFYNWLEDQFEAPSRAEIEAAMSHVEAAYLAPIETPA